MKTKIFLIAMIGVVSMAFVGWQNDDSDTNKMEGPWQLRSIHLYEDNKISDSIVSNDEYKQIKNLQQRKSNVDALRSERRRRMVWLRKLRSH